MNNISKTLYKIIKNSQNWECFLDENLVFIVSNDKYTNILCTSSDGSPYSFLGVSRADIFKKRLVNMLENNLWFDSYNLTINDPDDCPIDYSISSIRRNIENSTYFHIIIKIIRKKICYSSFNRIFDSNLNQFFIINSKIQFAHIKEIEQLLNPSELNYLDAIKYGIDEKYFSKYKKAVELVKSNNKSIQFEFFKEEKNKKLRYLVKVLPFSESYFFSAVADISHDEFTEIEYPIKQIEKLTENASIGFWSLDIETQNVKTTQNVNTLLGYESKITDVSWWRRIVHTDDIRELDSAIDKLTKDEIDTYESDIRIKDSKDMWRYFLMRLHITKRSADNSPKEISAGVMEITNRKLRENENIRKHKYYHKLIGNIDHVSAIGYDKNGIINFWNKGSQKTFMISEKDALGQNIEKFLPENKKSRPIIFDEKLLKTSGHSFHYTQASNGEKVYLKSSRIYLKDDDIDQYFTFSIDITKELELLGELHGLESEHSNMLDNLPALISHYTLDDDHIYVNKAYADFLKYDQDKLVGVNLSEILHEKIFKLYQKNKNLALKDKIVNFEFEAQRYNGTYLSATLIPNKSNKGKITSIYCFIFNISDLKQTELKLLDSENKLRSLIETSPGVLHLTDKDGNNKYFSQNITKIFGYSPDNLEQDFLTWVHPDDKIRAKHLFKISYLKKCGHKNFEYKAIRKNGKSFYSSTSWEPMFDSDNNFDGFALYTVDITDRKVAELNSEAEKERLKVTLENIGEGVIATDLKGSIIIINNNARSLTAWSDRTPYGKSIDEILILVDSNTNSPIENPVLECIRTNKVIKSSSNILLVSSNGTERNIIYTVNPLTSGNQKIIGAVLVFRDITNKIKMDHEILRSQRLKSLGILAGGIAHDFNNILMGILGNLSLVRIRLGSNNPNFEQLNDAEKAVFRAKDLTNQLLTFASGGEPVKQSYSISEVIKNTAVFALHGSKVNHDIKIPQNLWFSNIDKGQISQAIQNILINAIHAMPDGGIIRITAENLEIKPAMGIHLPSGNYVKILIMDQGVGIPDNYIDRIFDPYFTTKKSGSGLGLSVAYSVIERHDGLLEVESTPEKGSAFIIYLPASEDYQPEDHEDVETHKGIGKILIMDDEKIVLKSATLMLEHFGYEVETAINGEEAIVKYKEALGSEKPYLLVIMDLTIPGGMGGDEASTKILELDPNAKMIVSSGYSNDPVMANYDRHGFLGRIQKPYTVEALSKVVRKIGAKSKT